jgi:hypothetical protein
LTYAGRCETDVGWEAWQIAFIIKLNATMGARKVPAVEYFVCPDVDGDHEFEDHEVRQMCQMPLPGEHFKRGIKLVYTC